MSKVISNPNDKVGLMLYNVVSICLTLRKIRTMVWSLAMSTLSINLILCQQIVSKTVKRFEKSLTKHMGTPTRKLPSTKFFGFSIMKFLHCKYSCDLVRRTSTMFDCFCLLVMIVLMQVIHQKGIKQPTTPKNLLIKVFRLSCSHWRSQLYRDST